MIPNLFTKLPIPEKIPESMEQVIKEFAIQKDKEDFVKKCFDLLVSKHHGSRINIILKFRNFYKNDIADIWNHKGFFYCTTLNYLLRMMMIKSELFKEQDIELKLTNTWYLMPHQYLRIRINKEKLINVDPWAYQFGIEFGDHGHGFHSGNIQPIRTY